MGKVTSQTSASVSLPKKGKTMTLRSEKPEGLVPFASTYSRVPSKADLRGGVLSARVLTGSLEGEEKGRRVNARQALSVPGKRSSPTQGVPTPA